MYNHEHYMHYMHFLSCYTACTSCHTTCTSCHVTLHVPPVTLHAPPVTLHALAMVCTVHTGVPAHDEARVQGTHSRSPVRYLPRIPCECNSIGGIFYIVNTVVPTCTNIALWVYPIAPSLPVSLVQRVIKVKKTEDDEDVGEELTEEEIEVLSRGGH